MWRHPEGIGRYSYWTTRSADEAVAATRVIPPVLPVRYVAREHLLGPLRAAVEDPRVALVLFSAPAGPAPPTPW